MQSRGKSLPAGQEGSRGWDHPEPVLTQIQIPQLSTRPSWLSKIPKYPAGSVNSRRKQPEALFGFPLTK